MDKNKDKKDSVSDEYWNRPMFNELKCVNVHKSVLELSDDEKEFLQAGDVLLLNK